MTAIEVCRTAALGGHLERCDSCPFERPCYDSCRDRHCPKCQSLARAEWLEKRKAEILQTHYFHVVFTLPEQVAAIAYQNKDLVYGILFRATAETLCTISCRSPTSGRRDRFLRCTAQLGTEPALSSPPALCRSGWRDLPRRYPFDSLPPQFLLARTGPVLPLPPLFLTYLQEAFDAGKLRFFSSLAALQKIHLVSAVISIRCTT